VGTRLQPGGTNVGGRGNWAKVRFCDLGQYFILPFLFSGGLAGGGSGRLPSAGVDACVTSEDAFGGFFLKMRESEKVLPAE
jgi:hypothetical protein